MDEKLNYISQLLKKASSKGIEHYVISRLWHTLDNYDIKMVPQQYVSKQKGKYALTDVYFPQIGFHVEVNEPAHYHSDEKIEFDKTRNMEIENNTGHKVFIIDCRQDLEGIHSQIADVVSKINQAVQEQKDNGTFKPWSPQDEMNPKLWINKGAISLSDEVSFRTIEDICELFGADHTKTKRGFLRKGGIDYPNNPQMLIWWPAATPRSGWLNAYDEPKGIITESNIDKEKTIFHYNKHVKETYIRVVFLHYKDILGRTNYKFVGIFSNDKEASSPEIGTVWKRIGDTIYISTGEYYYKDKAK